jgi:hypothetical protein
MNGNYKKRDTIIVYFSFLLVCTFCPVFLTQQIFLTLTFVFFIQNKTPRHLPDQVFFSFQNTICFLEGCMRINDAWGGIIFCLS